MAQQKSKIKTAGDCVNEALFWLEGVCDGTSLTRQGAMALLAQAIHELQEAYTRLMYA